MGNYRRTEVYYSGNVQGVGFRYRTVQIALQFDLGGFVRNLEDGRVQIVAEGDHAELLEFLREIDRQMALNVNQKTVSWQKAQGQFVGFVSRA